MPNFPHFHDVLFPTDVGFGAQRSVSRPTQIVTLGSGHEQRNQRWRHSKRRYDAGFGVKTIGALHDVASFFEARHGAQYAFRFRDHLDWKSCSPQQEIAAIDQALGEGDGTKAEFALVKNYGSSNQSYQRPIVLPQSGSVQVAVDGAVVKEGVDYSFDYQSSAIVFEAASIPQAGEIVTAGFAFDVPVRFVDEDLTINLAAFDAGDIPSIPLQEVKL